MLEGLPASETEPHNLLTCSLHSNSCFLIENLGQTDRQETGLWQRQRPELAVLGVHPEMAQAGVLVITPLPHSVRCLKPSRAWESRRQHGDTPTAADFLEAVKVIDLSPDRLKGTQRVSQREIKLFPQVTPDFYSGRGLNLLR